MDIEELKKLGVSFISLSECDWQRSYTITDVEGNMYCVEVYKKDDREIEYYTLLKGRRIIEQID
jgi:hypothetical protein